MRRSLGGFFFVAAGLYMVITKPPGLITLLAVAGCSLIAGLAVTRHSSWAITGSAALIAGSLLLQSFLENWCQDCIKAGMMLLAGMIALSTVQWLRLKKAVKILVVAMTVMMPAVVLVHNVPWEAGAETAQPAEKGRYIAVFADNSSIFLDSAVKPVLFYSPSCGACAETLVALVGLDPEGRQWAPVQVVGDPREGREYLRAKGYLGESFYSDWDGPVPAMVFTRGGETVVVTGAGEMLEIAGGDAG